MMTIAEASTTVAFAQDLADCETLQGVWGERGLQLRDENHESFLTVDRYLAQLCIASNEVYYPMSQEKRELFAFALGSFMPVERKFLMVRADRSNG